METIPEGQKTLSSYISGRVGVFIDEANLFHSQKKLKWRIDYQKLYWLLRDLDLGTRNIFIYASFLRGSTKQSEFIDKLVEYGYFVHSKKVKEIKTISGEIIRKGNLDIELAIDAFQFSFMYDTCIIFSGDSDFDYLLEQLKHLGKKILVISSRKNMSYELMRRSDYYFDLKRLRPHIEVVAHKSLEATLAGSLGGTTLTSLSR